MRGLSQPRLFKSELDGLMDQAAYEAFVKSLG